MCLTVEVMDYELQNVLTELEQILVGMELS